MITCKCGHFKTKHQPDSENGQWTGHGACSECKCKEYRQRRAEQNDPFLMYGV